jgi:hypothetical protein
MHPSTTHLAGRTALHLLAVLAMLAALLAPMLIGSPAWADHTDATEYPGNPGCQAIADSVAPGETWTEYKIDDIDKKPELDGDYGDPVGGKLTGPSEDLEDLYVTLSNTDEHYFDYELGDDFPPVFKGVIVKGGDSALFYEPADGTTGLHAPLNTSGQTDEPHGLSHISFCSGPGTPPPPSAELTVLKAFDPIEAGDESDYQATVDSTDVDWGATNTFDPGSYLITETYTGEGDDPLQLEGIACVDDAEASVEYDAETGVTLADGDNVTCTLTNVPVPTEPEPEPEPATLTLLKQVIDNADDGAVFSDFTPTVKDGEGADVIEGVAFQDHGAENPSSYVIEPGTYTLGEVEDDVYELEDLSCEGGTFDEETRTLTVAEGDDVVCTYVNENAEVAGVIIEEPEDPAPDPDPAPEVESEELAQTGLDAPWLAVLSALFLALGTALLRRTAPLTRTVRRLGS